MDGPNIKFLFQPCISTVQTYILKKKYIKLRNYYFFRQPKYKVKEVTLHLNRPRTITPDLDLLYIQLDNPFKNQKKKKMKRQKKKKKKKKKQNNKLKKERVEISRVSLSFASRGRRASFAFAFHISKFET